MHKKITFEVRTKDYDKAYSAVLRMVQCVYPHSYCNHYERFNTPTMDSDETVDLYRADHTHQALGWVHTDAGMTVTTITVCLIK